MNLKNYQQRVLTAVRDYLTQAQLNRQTLAAAQAAMPAEYRHLMPSWVTKTAADLRLSFADEPRNGLGAPYPRVCVKVPTGGGKTLLAVETIREFQNQFARRRTGLVVWVIPSEIIYSQTVERLRDKGYYLRQFLDQCSGGHTLVLEKGQRLTRQDVAENLVVLFVMVQSLARTAKPAREALKIFQDSGGFDSFFPPDHRLDLHQQLLAEVPNLDVVSDVSRADYPLVRTSLGNAIRLTNPLIIVDELHKVFTDTARATLDGLNPAAVVGFTATPKAGMNILVSVSGLELKDEEMVKLDMHLLPPTSRQPDDWRSMVRDVRTRREALEAEAHQLLEQRGLYVRPAALLQVEATGKDQRGRGRVHSLDVKEYLVEIGIPADQIAIKTSAQNDIEDVNLLARDCPVRYLITRDALREGWDFPFAYVLGIIPNVGSNSGLTQLVGRILRQPYARKFGIPALDESYVYFTKGETQQLLEAVATGFRQEGLDDLVASIQPPGGGGPSPTKKVHIRPEFAGSQQAFYLPVWTMPAADGTRRRFGYELDIRSRLDFMACAPTAAWLATQRAALSQEALVRNVFTVTLDQQSHTNYQQVVENGTAQSDVSLTYLTRRLDEVVEHPFVARQLAVRLLAQLTADLTAETVAAHFGFLTAQLVSWLGEERRMQEERIFAEYVATETLQLAVSDAPTVGYCIPTEDVIAVDRVPHSYRYYLYDDVETAAMNGLEKQVGSILDRQETILWWFRNKVSRGWYAIQGWRRHKIRPDFVAAKKRADGTLELVYVIESKGEHLVGNADTTYKAQVLETMNSLPKQRYQQQLALEFGTLNENVGYYLIEQGQEAAKIRTLFS